MTIADMKKRVEELAAEKHKLEEEIASLESNKFKNDSFAYEMDAILNREAMRSKIRIKTIQGEERHTAWQSINYIDEEDEIRSISQSIVFFKKLSHNAKDMIQKLSRRIDMYKESKELSEHDFSSTK